MKTVFLQSNESNAPIHVLTDSDAFKVLNEVCHENPGAQYHVIGTAAPSVGILAAKAFEDLKVGDNLFKYDKKIIEFIDKYAQHPKMGRSFCPTYVIEHDELEPALSQVIEVLTLTTAHAVKFIFRNYWIGRIFVYKDYYDWENNGWIYKTNQNPVSCKELWQQLLQIVRGRRISVTGALMSRKRRIALASK